MQERVSFGQWLDAEIERRGWSRSELARRMNVWSSLISKWANDQQRPQPPQCHALADALGFDPDYVLHRAGHRSLSIDAPSRLHHEAMIFLERIPDDLVAFAVPLLSSLADPEQEDAHRARFRDAVAMVPARSPKVRVDLDKPKRSKTKAPVEA